MPTYEITGVAEGVRDWQSNLGGPMRSYRIDLKADDGTDEPLIEWARKVASPMPTVGMKLEGNIETGQYGKKFKQAQQGGYGGGSKDFKADPVKQAAIAMETAQKSAVEILRLAMDCKAWAPSQDGKPVSEMTGVVKSIAASLYAQISEVSEAAK